MHGAGGPGRMHVEGNLLGLLSLTVGLVSLTALTVTMVLRAENTELRASLDAALAENGRMLQQSAPLPWSDADRTRALQELNGVANLGSHAATTGMHHGLCVEKHGDADTPKVRGSVAAMRECASKKHMMDSTAITREGNVSVRVNGKVISVDDISYGMEALFQQRHMHSQVTFFGVGMQQDPNDAIAIADLLWRVRPRLLIELGTSGGGSALFYARAMREYDPLARVLTMDPSSDTTPLKNWNHDEMAKFCSHCVAASSTRLWKDTVTFIRELPTSEAALAKATE